MHRFFVAPELLSHITSITLPKPIAHQVRNVLHLSVGEQLLLLDNTGDEVLATVTTSNRNTVDVQLLERRAGKSEPPIRITLCQGLLKSARFEWILEKGTELGVTVFAPTLCRRSMSGLEEAGPAKIQRWQRIIQEAAEQSGRSRLPALLPIQPLMHALNNIPHGALAIMPWEQEHNRSLHEALITGLQQNPAGEKNERSYVVGALSEACGAAMQSGDTCPQKRVLCVDSFAPRDREGPTRDDREHSFHQSITVVLFIGPEGGLTTDEITLAQRRGVQPVTLGPRILRSETAALATIANVLYELA